MDLGQFTSDISSGALLATAAGLYTLSVTAFLILESRKPQSTFARLFVLCLFPAGGLSFAAVATAALVHGDRPASLLPAVQSALPEPLERYLAALVRPSQSERAQLMAGDPITKLLESDPSREVAVFGAVWIKASPARYVKAVKDIEKFERGSAMESPWGTWIYRTLTIGRTSRVADRCRRTGVRSSGHLPVPQLHT